MKELSRGEKLNILGGNPNTSSDSSEDFWTYYKKGFEFKKAEQVALSIGVTTIPILLLGTAILVRRKIKNRPEGISGSARSLLTPKGKKGVKRRPSFGDEDNTPTKGRKLSKRTTINTSEESSAFDIIAEFKAFAQYEMHHIRGCYVEKSISKTLKQELITHTIPFVDKLEAQGLDYAQTQHLLKGMFQMLESSISSEGIKITNEQGREGKKHVKRPKITSDFIKIPNMYKIYGLLWSLSMKNDSIAENNIKDIASGLRRVISNNMINKYDINTISGKAKLMREVPRQSIEGTPTERFSPFMWNVAKSLFQ